MTPNSSLTWKVDKHCFEGSVSHSLQISHKLKLEETFGTLHEIVVLLTLDRITNLGIKVYLSFLFICFLFVFVRGKL